MDVSDPGSAPPPAARVENVVDAYFGHQVVDPYRWMEAPNSEELAAWLAAKNQHARAILDRLPGRDALLARLTEVSEAGALVYFIQRRGERLFYLKVEPGAQNAKLCMREQLAGAERVLVDTEHEDGDGHASITTYGASHDGQLVCFLVSPSGSEYGTLRVLEVDTGRLLDDRIERTRWDAGPWLPGNDAFLYQRFLDLPDDAPSTDRLRSVRVYRHRLGSATEADRPFFGWDVSPDNGFGDRLLPFVSLPPGSSHAIGLVSTGVSPNFAFYVAPIGSLDEDPVPWRQVAGLEDQVRQVAIHGDHLYLLSFKDAPRSKVLRCSLQEPDLESAETVWPESEAIVEDIVAARDGLYLENVEAGASRLYRIDHATLRAEAIVLPPDESAYLQVGDVLHDGVLFKASAWTQSPALMAYRPGQERPTDTGLMAPVAVDMSGIEVLRVDVPSHDGVKVPLVILHRRGLALGGRNPTLMEGYGAYGTINTTPFFNPHLLPWLERGGVYAIAGVRGGGEYGEAWHLAGKEATKPNTWKDFIACGQYLVAEGFTRPEQLAGEGTSAGGLLICNAVVERPDLFAAAIVNVGLTNALRMETTANGVPNIPEFGSHTTEDGFRALLAMDAYHKVAPGVPYPAVLFTHGIKDPRVDPWFSAKMAAQLQRCSSSDSPVLLRIDDDAGHGVGSTKAQRNGLLADTYAFLFDRLGAGAG